MSPDDFRKLVSAGLNTDQIALVMEMIEAKDKAFAEAEEARKSKGRERVAKWRAERNVTVTEQKVTVPLTRDRVAPVDDKLKHTDIPKSKNNTAKDEAEFRDALASLGSDRLNAMVQVRKAKKAPINAYSARLFTKAAANCGISIEEAADVSIERNWLTVKPDWLQRPAVRGSPAPHQPNNPRNISEASAATAAYLRELENGTQPDPHGERLGQDVLYLAASRS